MTTPPPNSSRSAEALADGDGARRRLAGFSPIEVRKTSDAVLVELVDAMRRGRLEPGDALPSERELALSLKVSRKVVRDAIDTLRREGIVSVRRGSGGGTVVESLGGLPRVLAGVQPEDRERLRGLLEVRRALETSAAIAAASRASEGEVHALGRLAAAMEHAMERPRDFAELDLRFHLTLAEMSRNPVCVDFLRQTLDRISVIREEKPYAYVPQLGVLRKKQAIVAALGSGDVRRLLVALDDDLATVESVLVGERLAALVV
jgi:DNA-binding FadR family transcriptional regulator